MKISRLKWPLLACLPIVIANTLVVSPMSFAQAQSAPSRFDNKFFQDLRWRSIGPHRGGRALAVTGIRDSRNYSTLAPWTAAYGAPMTRGERGIPFLIRSRLVPSGPLLWRLQIRMLFTSGLAKPICVRISATGTVCINRQTPANPGHILD